MPFFEESKQPIQKGSIVLILINTLPAQKIK